MDRSRIIVQGGKRLSFGSNVQIRSCARMWRGIVVEDGGQVSFRPNCTFRDANVALQFLGGGSLSLNSCSFVGNKRVIDSGIGGINSINSVNNAGMIVGCYFNSGLFKPSDFPTFIQNCAINLGNTSDFFIGVNSQQADVGLVNIFEGYDHGIYANFVNNLLVRNSRFINNGNQPLPWGIFLNRSNGVMAGLGQAEAAPAMFMNRNGVLGDRSTFRIQNARFFNSVVGVGATNGNNQSLRVADNSFRNCETGVNKTWCSNYTTRITGSIYNASQNTLIQNPLNNASFVRIVNSPNAINDDRVIGNIFTGLRTTSHMGVSVVGGGRTQVNFNFITLQSNSPQFRAIRFENNHSNATLRNNVLTGAVVIGAPDNNIGIALENSSLSFIECNNLAAFPSGFRFEGACQMTNHLTNDMGNHGNAIRVIGAANTQIGIQIDKGNRFLGVPVSTEAVIQQSNHISTTFSRYEVRNQNLMTPQQINEFWPLTWAPADFFGPSSLGSLPFCADPSFNGHDWTEIEQQIVEGGFNTSNGIPLINAWSSRWTLNEYLTGNPNLLGTSNTILNWYNAEQLTPRGKLFKIAKGIENLETPTSSQKATIDQNQEQYFILNDQLQGLFDNLANTTDSLLRIPIIGSINTKRSQINSNAIATSIIRDSIQALVPSKLAVMSSGFNSIVAGNILEQKLKDVQGVLLAVFATPNYTITPTQTAQLTTIANSCAWTDGRGVLDARSILLRDNAILTWDDATICTGQYRLETPETGSPSVSVFPNPSSDNRIYIKVNGIETITIHSIEIYSSNGTLVASTNTTGKQIEEINTNGLSNGVYYAKVTLNSGRVDHVKFVKQ